MFIGPRIQVTSSLNSGEPLTIILFLFFFSLLIHFYTYLLGVGICALVLCVYM